jgi:hypothetical protein
MQLPDPVADTKKRAPETTGGPLTEFVPTVKDAISVSPANTRSHIAGTTDIKPLPASISQVT